MNDFKEYLSDLEIAKIKSFVEDKAMFEAVRKVLLKGIYENGTLVPGKKANATRNFALTFNIDPKIKNEDLGADLRATVQGISFVELGFTELEKVSPAPVKSPLQQDNPGE